MWAWRNKLLLSLLYIYLKGGTKNEGTKVGRLKDIPVENPFRWKKTPGILLYPSKHHTPNVMMSLSGRE